MSSVRQLGCTHRDDTSDAVTRFLLPVKNRLWDTTASAHVSSTGANAASPQPTQQLSPHSTTPTPTPTSSRKSSRECRRIVQLATGITSGNGACRTCMQVFGPDVWNSLPTDNRLNDSQPAFPCALDSSF